MDYNLLQPFGQGNPEPKYLLLDYLPQRDVQRMQFKKLDNKMESDWILSSLGRVVHD